VKFSHAIRYGWATQNPITAVRTSSKRLKDPEILTTQEFRDLVCDLDQRERVIVLLAGSTALRRGELFGLRWEDVDFEKQLVRVTHSIFRNVQGDTKTAASRKPVPLPPIVVEELKQWRATSLYRSEKDYLFPSAQKNGEQPLQPDMILKRHIRPALQHLGNEKAIGWHSFRHGMSNLLRECGVDVKSPRNCSGMRIPGSPWIFINKQSPKNGERPRRGLSTSFGTTTSVLLACQAIEPTRTHGGLRRKRSSR